MLSEGLGSARDMLLRSRKSLSRRRRSARSSPQRCALEGIDICAWRSSRSSQSLRKCRKRRSQAGFWPVFEAESSQDPKIQDAEEVLDSLEHDTNPETVEKIAKLTEFARVGIQGATQAGRDVCGRPQR